ncbi:MAG TPA: hypothetical protein VEU54_03920 [Steroidobacteraceae bacterium]|jgi:sterol desaturase/sphingolipid hydroxylase (fatty acid hydroxylase superfamily)|nr:hypothetical protein [Steroidobacteraceae bacterium]
MAHEDDSEDDSMHVGKLVRDRVRRTMKGVVLGVVAIVGIAVFAFIVMLLWNWLVPELFHGPRLGYWQTAGLLVLCRILFGGFGGARHGHWRRHHWREHWEALTPEERARLRERFFEQRCGRGAG